MNGTSVQEEHGGAWFRNKTHWKLTEGVVLRLDQPHYFANLCLLHLPQTFKPIAMSHCWRMRLQHLLQAPGSLLPLMPTKPKTSGGMSKR